MYLKPVKKFPQDMKQVLLSQCEQLCQALLCPDCAHQKLETSSWSSPTEVELLYVPLRCCCFLGCL